MKTDESKRMDELEYSRYRKESVEKKERRKKRSEKKKKRVKKKKNIEWEDEEDG